MLQTSLFLLNIFETLGPFTYTVYGSKPVSGCNLTQQVQEAQVSCSEVLQFYIYKLSYTL